MCVCVHVQSVSYRQLNCPLADVSDGACDVNSAATLLSLSPSSTLLGTRSLSARTVKEIAFPEPIAAEIRGNFAP